MSKYLKFCKAGEPVAQLSTLEIRESIEDKSPEGNDIKRVSAAVTRTGKVLSQEETDKVLNNITRYQTLGLDELIPDYIASSGLKPTKTTDKTLALFTEMKHLYGRENKVNARYDVLVKGSKFQGVRYCINVKPYFITDVKGTTLGASITEIVLGDTIEDCDREMDFRMKNYVPTEKMEDGLWGINNSDACKKELQDIVDASKDKRELTNGTAWSKAKTQLIALAQTTPVVQTPAPVQTPPVTPVPVVGP